MAKRPGREDLVSRALSATAESRQIEFKEGLDPGSSADWCELTKDFVALANSGGGVLVIGLNSDGSISSRDISSCLSLDPAEFANKIGKYVGLLDVEFELGTAEKQSKRVLLVVIAPRDVPLVFERPGTYLAADGKQKTTFSLGQVYFRRGARSAPGTTDDLRRAIDRRVNTVRADWLNGLRRVVEAEPGSRIVALPPASSDARALISTVRAVSDEKAQPVYIIRGQVGSGATFVHEELSEGIFDEINNVIGANRLLSRGKNTFVFGSPTYYRIYAERQHVKSKADVEMLYDYSILDLYAPFTYWIPQLRPERVARTFAIMFLKPRDPQIHALMRVAIIAGEEFTDWVMEKWKVKWGKHPQPPRFVHAFRDMARKASEGDRRLAALRMTPKLRITLGASSFLAEDLIKQPSMAGTLLSKACMGVFDGDKNLRTPARQFDLIAHGDFLMEGLGPVFQALKKVVGKRLPEDLLESGQPEGDS